MPPLTVFPVEGVPEVRSGDVLAELLVTAARAQDTPFAARDCLVVTQKVVSKAEGRVVPLDASDPAARRELVESESARVLRRRGELIISETRHGFVCANAGVDLSNVDDGYGRELQVTEVALADEIAGAAELVKGKAARVPAAVVRGLDPDWFRDGSARELVRPPGEDLFR